MNQPAPSPKAVAAPPPTNKQIADVLRRKLKHPFTWGLVLGSIIAVAVVLLIVQNGESAQIDWLWMHFRAPLWVVLFLTLVAGALVWETVKLVTRRARHRNADRRKALADLARDPKAPKPAKASP